MIFSFFVLGLSIGFILCAFLVKYNLLKYRENKLEIENISILSFYNNKMHIILSASPDFLHNQSELNGSNSFVFKFQADNTCELFIKYK